MAHKNRLLHLFIVHEILSIKSNDDYSILNDYILNIAQIFQRNSAIKLYGLPWGFPGWIGEGTNNPYVNITQTADYVVRWVNAAKQIHGLTIDYLGVSLSSYSTSSSFSSFIRYK